MLGLKTRQLNGDFKYPNGVTDNQLHTLGHIGIFDAAFDARKISHYPRLANVTNTDAALGAARPLLSGCQLFDVPSPRRRGRVFRCAV